MTPRGQECPRHTTGASLRVDAAVGFLVAILDDDGGVNRESPFLSFSAGDGAGAGHDDGALRDDEAAIWAVSAIDRVFDGVEERGGAREDGSRAEHRAGANLGAFVNAAIATDQGVILDDYGGCIYRSSTPPICAAALT